MAALLRLSRMIDAVTRFIGHHVRWLILAAGVVAASVIAAPGALVFAFAKRRSSFSLINE